LISSAIFAAGHLGNVLVLVDAFWVSLLDIYLDNKARSLAPSIADHVSYNFVLAVIKFTRT
jgi:membrane protease YdiL (CAAX protease family)